MFSMIQLGIRHPYGFFGISGLLGVLLGILVMAVVLLAFWQIFTILARKFALDADIVMIIKIILGLCIFLWFINLIFGIFG